MRALTLLGIACLAGALALVVLADSDGATLAGAALFVFALLIGFVLKLRSAALGVRATVVETHRFVRGGVGAARIVEVGDPRGVFSPESNVVFEVDSKEGETKRFERGVPVPFPYAWGYRFGRRFNMPFVSRIDLTKTLAHELRLGGTKVDAPDR